MSLRKRLVMGIGLILLILGIGKPLTEAVVQALKPKAVQTSGTDTPRLCKQDCPENGKPLNIPFRSWFSKKPVQDDEDGRAWKTNQKTEPIKKIKRKPNNVIIVGFKNVEQILNGKGRSSLSMLLMSLLVLPLVIISYIVWRKRRKTKKQDEESIKADIPSQSLANDFVSTENPIELPDAWIRKQLIQFNHILPVRLQRHDTETLQEWCLRIGFQPSPILTKTYLLERYTERATTISEMDKQTIQREFGAFFHQFD
ncbi:hypothetical protein ACV3PA_03160 [Exiguobacterium acetylicum]|uniref:hypothetical protein n=1 Tax=Exiguobacterium sp. BMC-KP TaxID=1684312 RepID=UPI0006AA535D|nr:hypothetical protein [Exiguobacterium sp. BMC-KP]KOP31235.1 hypothetical protein ADM98_02155 [Exiguobacterium sp. BMC-KP]